MRLKTFFVRFYKSFNFDYLRKYHNSTHHQPWDYVGELCYPYVRIPIDAKVTAVVGANESGKSHLLSAIEKGLTGEKIAVEDMCRYSQFYTVELGKRKLPDFGFEFDGLEEAEKTLVAPFFDESPDNFESFFFFRSQNNIDLYLPPKKNEETRSVTLKAKEAEKLQKLLPHTFQIKSNIALPNNVPILSLIEREDKNFYPPNREVRIEAIETLQRLAKSKKFFDSVEAVANNAATVYELMNPLLEAVKSGKSDSKDEIVRKEEIKLARDLISKIANVDPDALRELYSSIKDGKDGHAAGLIQNINQQLEKSLNFPHWWVQDKQFQLVVTAREVDLVFTIRDRTGTEYSFSERSNGLKYFLSYYVQYLAHEPINDKNEILLMDEPDAYLSSQAQQDLLKIFDSFASPESSEKLPVQVIYVTHSPFLIDKNHAERIRVLEKGVSEEGTRVVKDAGKNHYEPLRSAFGAFVGETVFIGNTNLFVEGLADQILLAGSAIHLRKSSKLQDETLDLNQLTIVPAGSASHIPYLVYLARGRDVEKPAVVVLLDSDTSGNNAKRSLKRGGANSRQLLRDDLILQIGEVKNANGLSLPTGELIETEDLVPLPLCVNAVRQYLKSFAVAPDEMTQRITVDLIKQNITEGKTLFDAIEKSVESLSKDFHIEKVGFARSLIDVLKRQLIESGDEEIASAITEFENNMKILFSRINKMRREAERELTAERVSAKVDRLKKAFVRDYVESPIREHAYLLFEEIDASLDNTRESDSIRTTLQRIRRDFQIDDERHLPINNYYKFKESLEEIYYSPKHDTQES